MSSKRERDSTASLTPSSAARAAIFQCLERALIVERADFLAFFDEGDLGLDEIAGRACRPRRPLR
jgi:hypothetical protein